MGAAVALVTKGQLRAALKRRGMGVKHSAPRCCLSSDNDDGVNSEEDDEEDGEEDGLNYSVAPWAEDIRPRPIFILSDCTGEGVQMLVSSAWRQFSSSEAADLRVKPSLRTAELIDMIVAEASRCNPVTDSDGNTSRAFVVFSFASYELSSYLALQCRRHHIECLDAVGPLLTKMNECFVQVHHFKSCGSTVFAVSCGQGNCTFQLVCDALRRSSHSKLEEVTVCPEVRSLEEVKLIVQKAAEAGALIAFTFASPGMSRFMRQQCEVAGVRCSDLFQPLLISMELYLDHPFFGIAGGLDVNALAEAEHGWERRRVV